MGQRGHLEQRTSRGPTGPAGVVFCRWADALRARRLAFAAERRPPASEHSRTRLQFRSNNRRALDDFCNLAPLLKKAG